MAMNVLFKKIFSIEGNIGAGKTTLLGLLEKQIPNCKVIYEPVNEWKNVGGTDLLKSFYTEPKRWCFTFELESMVSKIRLIKEALKSEYDVILLERSLHTDKCFQVASFYYDKLNSMEMQILDDLRNDFMKEYPVLNGIIYLDTDVTECLARIKARGRTEESGIDKAYLMKLEDLFLTAKYGCQMVMVDGSYDPSNPQKTINMILKFINKCV